MTYITNSLSYAVRRETPMPAPTTTINLRATAHFRDLIDRGAAVAGKTRTQFILEASVAAAQNALLDQTYFALSSAQLAEFQRVMDAPLSSNSSVAELLATRAPWEEHLR